ncbi:MAG: TetR/AcrR family transcriptional regulator [Chroococcidiopsidaceae cyanobacterium CP_BM_RX_35]|nr:TetR/AcrR family transcriptional regulator [Chroococcidiopsidaceae cyanobacterium CP_BM_RX_35]
MSVHSSQQLSQGKPMPGASPPISSKLDNAALKREQILKGATQVFLQHGYAGTSMDRVAAAARVSKQTIYTHFQDKNGLFTALIERVTTRQLQAEFGTEPFQGEPITLLRRIAQGYLKKMDDQEFIDLLRVVVAESARFPELAKLYTRTVIQPICLGLSIYFESHPELNLPDPAATAQIFFGTLSAFILSQQLLYGKQFMPMENERLVDSLVELCCKNHLGD